jgi:hypothetical protein
MKPFLIAIDKLKQLGLIHPNSDDKNLRVCVMSAQDMNIQPAIGTPLYKALLTRVENDVWTPEYRTLMDEYIVPCLARWCDFHAAYYLHTKITNKTVGANRDEYQNANSSKETSEFRSKLQSDAQFYTDRLIGFLKDNCEIYPEYKEHTCNHEDVKKQKEGYYRGWF